MRKPSHAVSMFLICWLCIMPGLARANPPAAEVVNQWCLDAINAPLGLSPSTGEGEVRVAVVDSGIWVNNPYIDGDSVIDGYNYALESSVTHDLIGHGSQVAATIVGAQTEGGELIGLGSSARIVPLVWITKYPSGVTANGGVSALSKAIRDAVDVYDCRIINVSSGITTDEPELREAVAYAEEKGAILISAVGNRNRSDPAAVYYPAAYGTVVGVGSIDHEMSVSDFSQRNASVMVTAPGESVASLSSEPSLAFTEVSGTSHAAAYVSGFAALLLSRFPEMTPAQFREVLKDSSQDLGEPGYDTSYGYGLIDVSRALLMAGSSEIPIPYFADLSGPYEEYVVYLAERGIVTGKSRDTFAPADTLTRAEFATMLARMSGEPLASTGSGFQDVHPGNWFAPYVLWAKDAGIVQGYDGMFHPEGLVTRQDMAVMLARLTERFLEGPLPYGNVTFGDAHLVAAYALASVAGLLEAGIMDMSSSNLFAPLALATRGEAAKACALAMRMLELG